MTPRWLILMYPVLVLAQPAAIRLPDAVMGRDYQAQIRIEGPASPTGRPRLWSAEESLPRGLSLDARSGLVYGRASRPGLWIAVVKVSEPGRPTVEREVRLAVVTPLRVNVMKLPPLGEEAFDVQLEAAGGTPPYQWRVKEGDLPDGVLLDPSGRLRGKTGAGWDWRVQLEVADSGMPEQRAFRDFGWDPNRPLAVDWRRRPQSRDGGVFGSVIARNNSSRETFDLTIVVVAVNEYGKAFTLGYQRFSLLPGTPTPEVPFGFTLPRGHYTAHVDAVAEVPPQTIHRARRQLPGLVVE